MAFPPLERLEHIQGAINVPVGQVSMQGKERWTEVIDTAASGACLPGLGPNLVFSRDRSLKEENGRQSPSPSPLAARSIWAVVRRQGLCALLSTP